MPNWGSAMQQGDPVQNLSQMLMYGAGRVRPIDDEEDGQGVAVAPAPVAAAPVTAATAPVAPTRDYAEYTKLEQSLANAQRPVDAATVRPTIAQRTLGGLSSALMAFGRVPGAVEMGSNIVNQRRNQAEAARAGNIQTAQTAIQGYKDRTAMQDRDFENQIRGYQAGQEGERTGIMRQEATDRQGNANREFGRLTANDTYTHDRDAKLDQAAADARNWEQGFKTREQAERERNDRATNAIGWAREGREAKKDARDAQLNSPTARLEAKAADIRKNYGERMDQLENGNPKGATTAEMKGFKASLREVQNSKVNPETQEAWTDKERDAYVADMKQAHADRKNGLQQRMASELNQIGVKETPVQYDAEGNVIKRSNNNPSNNSSRQPQRGQIDRATVKQYIDKAGGDVEKARKMARGDGWQF